MGSIIPAFVIFIGIELAIILSAGIGYFTYKASFNYSNSKGSRNQTYLIINPYKCKGVLIGFNYNEYGKCISVTWGCEKEHVADMEVE